ncbi:hypothetical protein [Marinobacter sp.]|uniref:hypothetical protein n=1 Tax=Marinobacter sp. TaxID=50741 RepID=UPI003A8F7391
MSKRFGRNQKRKLKEQARAAEAQCETYRQWYEQSEMLGARNRRIVEATAEVLGNHFITLPPDELSISSLDLLQTGLRVSHQSSLPPWDVNASLDRMQTFLERTLPALYGTVHLNELQQHTHFRLTYEGRPVGYTIQQSSLALLPKDVVIERVATELAQHFQHELNGKQEAA